MKIKKKIKLKKRRTPLPAEGEHDFREAMNSYDRFRTGEPITWNMVHVMCYHFFRKGFSSGYRL